MTPFTNRKAPSTGVVARDSAHTALPRICGPLAVSPGTLYVASLRSEVPQIPPAKPCSTISSELVRFRIVRIQRLKASSKAISAATKRAMLRENWKRTNEPVAWE